MSREMLKRLMRAFPRFFRTSATPGVAAFGCASTELVPLGPIAPEPAGPRRNMAPIVQLPVRVDRSAPSPRVAATADLNVKLFRGRHVDKERYTATLRAVSDAPAALLAALADAAREVEELGRESAADEQLIMHISIRWQRPARDLTADAKAERSA
jgi:hypothetical protein